MKIYRGNTEILDVLISDRAVERRELMIEHCVTLDFELADYVALRKGDKVSYNGNYFYLNRDFVPAKNKQTDGYKYDLTFYDITERFKDFKLKYNQQVNGSNFDELEFYLTTDAYGMLEVVVSSLAQCGLGTYTIGNCPDEFKDIFFQNVDIHSALTQIAEAYQAEWWVDSQKAIHIGKLIVNENVPVLLEYDKGADNITLSQSDTEPITRLYAFGGSRNLPKDYRGVQSSNNVGQRRLRMRNEQGEAIDYIDYFKGSAALPQNQIIESVQTFEDVYPIQNNKIVEVSTHINKGNGTDTQDTTIYTIKGDNAFVISNNEIEAGKPLMISFLSGRCMGRDFELIIKADNRFEIKFTSENGNYFPNTSIYPAIGDSFFFYNVKADVLFPAIVPIAEKQLYARAMDYLNKLGETYVYDVHTRSIFCEKHNISLDLGCAVTLKSEWLGSVTSRVRKYEKSLQNEFEAVYVVSDNSEYSRLGNMEQTITKFITGAGGVDSIMLDKFMRAVRQYALSRLEDDKAEGLIKFAKGLEVGDFTQGALGAGAMLKMIDGKSELEVDKLTVRMMATFFELVISKLSHIGGQLILTPARMKCKVVEELTNAYRCYFEKGENGEVANDFVVGDQARCQVFTGSDQKYYWRLVVGVGADYVDLSKTDKDGVSIPEMGDDIVQLGNRSNTARQNAIVLSTVGSDAPSYKQYEGINSFSMQGKEKTVFSSKGNKIVGAVSFESGTTGLNNIPEWQELKEKTNEIEENIPISWELTPVSDKGVNAFNYDKSGTLNKLTYSIQWFRSGKDVTEIMKNSSKHLFDFERQNTYGMDDNGISDDDWNFLHRGQSQIILTDTDICAVGTLSVSFDENAVETEYQLLTK